MGVKLPVKARKEEQRLKTPHPPKSCRIWSCDAHADEAFLVLWASTNNQQGEKHFPLIEVSLYTATSSDLTSFE